jgi:hypothetical protein
MCICTAVGLDSGVGEVLPALDSAWLSAMHLALPPRPQLIRWKGLQNYKSKVPV